MSSEAGPSSLVLVKRSAGGTVEWIPLESPAQHVAVAAADAYTLIDRAHYEAPQTLVVERVGEDLVVEVHGHAALVLDGFFTAADVEFYPTTNIAAGAGPFSGPPLNADSAAVADNSTGKVVLWSADQGESEAVVAGSTAVATGTEVSGGSSPLLWVGLAAGGLGLAALAGGGGGSGGGESGGSGGGGNGGGDTTAPQITSGATAPPIAENSGAGRVVYTATATDASTVTYSLSTSGDADAFNINPNTGAVTLTANPNFEAKPSYSFTVVATDVAGNHSERAVSLAINNRDEVAPTITSGDTAAPIEDKSGPNQLVYTVTSTDTADIHTGNTTYSLKPVGDSDAFKIDADTGAVTLIRNPDFDKKSSYSFTVVATDAAGNDSERAVSLAITNGGDEAAPTITSGGIASPINENSGAGQAVYTAAATDASTVTYSLKTSGDADAFNIDRNTGAVTLTANPNFEAKPSYSFTVVATDVAGNHSERAVSLAINNRDEVAPKITSEGTASAIEEHSGPNQIVYTVTSTDTDDISTGNTTYSLKPAGDSGAFDINPSTGAVTLTANPNFQAKPSYSFTVVATDVAGNHSERAVSLAITNRDEGPPNITSAGTASPIAENSGAGKVVYTAIATDASTVTYSLSASGDRGAFNINANTGAVTLTANPNFETKPSYSFTVVATDVAGNHSERAVSLAINNRDEVAPKITSAGTASPIQENSGPNQIVYTVTSTDTADIHTGNTTYSLKPVGDSGAFNINPSTGAVSLKANPDFETKPSYSFTVVATDAAHNSSERAISLRIIDVDDTGPPPDTTPPTLSVSTPTDGAKDVPVEQNIVLVFSENVKVGSGTITLMDHGDELTINVNDGSQVSVSGNRVTINPAADLNSKGNYHVQIDAGAFTDLAGNPFAGGDTLHFMTVDENKQLSAALDGGRAFQIEASPEIDIRGATLTAATDGATLWSGSANLGSDARVMLVGADVSDPSAPSNAMSIMEAAIAWQSEPNGIIEGTLAHEASMPVAHDAVESYVDIAHLPVAMATSQGLV